VIYNSGSSPSTDSVRTYIDAENFCVSLGTRLATLDELCDGGEGGTPFAGGPFAGGGWVAYSGAAVPDPAGGASANTWVHGSWGAANPQCVVHHTEVGIYPAWGLVATGTLPSRPVTTCLLLRGVPAYLAFCSRITPLRARRRPMINGTLRI
jgi:hypothetical protein